MQPRKTPCASCPYRRGVPSGVWRVAEYDKLREYDRPTPEQPLAPFRCHQGAEELCSGWVGHRDPEELLAIRYGVARGHISPSTFTYTTEVELFAGGDEAAAHGTRDIQSPSEEAVAAMRKIIIARAHAGNPVELEG